MPVDSAQEFQTEFAQQHARAAVTETAARWLRAILRAIGLIAILFTALADGLLRHALGIIRTPADGALWIHTWSRRMLACMGVEFTTEGELPGAEVAAGRSFEAVICNHMSYLDILLLSAVRPFVMVAKREVRSWPAVGWLTAQAGTVYVARGGGPASYPGVNAAMAEAYRTGLPVLFFPEGTTTDGRELQPFRRGLFHSVLFDDVQVRAAAIGYRIEDPSANASVESDVCWVGDAELVPHLVRLIQLRRVRACVRFGARVPGSDRFALAENGHAAVSELREGLQAHSQPALARTVSEEIGLVEAL